MRYNQLIFITLLLVHNIFGSYAQRREEIGSHFTRQSIGGYNVYFGTLHNHSNVSDGLGTPHEAYYYAYRYSDYDFFGLADHDLMMEQSEWEAIKKAAGEFNKDGVFTTFWGFEWSSDVGHVAVVNSEEYCSSNVKPENTFKGFLNWVNNNECVAFFNHPGREDVYNNEFNHFSDSPSDKFVGIELWNGRDEFSRYYYNDGYYNNDGGKSFYDEAISRGWKIGAAGSEDNHRCDFGNYTHKRLAILADTLTRAALYEALKARRFYSTLDKTLALSFKVGENEMGAAVKSGTYDFKISAYDRESEMFTMVQVYKNGILLKGWNVIETKVNIIESFDTSPGDYFYVKLTQRDGDEAISSPVFIKKQNELTRKETDMGWELLFDGKTFDGWRGLGRKEVRNDHWKIEDGLIRKVSNEEVLEETGKKITGGDLMTIETFDNFQLSFEWKIGSGGNSGIKYNVSEEMSIQYEDGLSALGFEYQILDDESDLYKGKLKPTQFTASLYDMISPENVHQNPPGQFNQGRILLDGNKVEHWLNGVKVVEFELGTKKFDSLFQHSKYVKYPGFQERRKGHIVITDHSDDSWYRNIKIRRLY